MLSKDNAAIGRKIWPLREICFVAYLIDYYVFIYYESVAILFYIITFGTVITNKQKPNNRKLT